jgi:hypothetical protein
VTDPVAEGFALGFVSFFVVWGFSVPIRYALRMLGIIE